MQGLVLTKHHTNITTLLFTLKVNFRHSCPYNTVLCMTTAKKVILMIIFNNELSLKWPNKLSVAVSEIQ